MSQLRELAKPIPQKYLAKNSQGMDAVDHTVITQLLHLRVPGWSQEIVEVLRNDMPDFTGKNKSWPGGQMVTGVILRLTCTIDGHPTVIEEVGGVELPQMKDGDGERLKHALSDAIKRCAMRIGLGLHVWAGDSYFMDRALEKREEEPAAPLVIPATSGPAAAKAALGGVKT